MVEGNDIWQVALMILAARLSWLAAQDLYNLAIINLGEWLDDES